MTMELLLTAEAGKCAFRQINKRTTALKSNLQERVQEFLKRHGPKPGVPLFPELGCGRTTFPAGTGPRPAAPRRSLHPSIPAARVRRSRQRRGGRRSRRRGHPGGGREGERARETESARSRPHLCAPAPSPHRCRTDPPCRPWRQSGPAGAAQ